MKFLLAAVSVLLSVSLSGCDTVNSFLSASRTDPDSATLSVGCQNTPADLATCAKLVAPFEAQTGIDVVIKAVPNDSTLILALLSELNLTRSADVDVFPIDVVWPGIFSQDVLDLTPYFEQADLEDFFPRIVQNNTLDGKLLALPYYTDAGLLYYRADLLEKYGFNGPPETWAELQDMAQMIQRGERAAGNADFWGYVWQGNQYEGLTCDAVEWLASEGAGSVVEADGSISVNNAQTVAALERAKGWVGTISPPDVTELQEETARAIWQGGNAAFMRNWPYAYSLGNADDSAVQDLFDVAPLPKGASGQGGAALGGWQLAVSKHTDMKDEAIELVRWMTGPEAQKIQALELSNIPTRRSLYNDPEILAKSPFFANIPAILDAATARPSTVTGAKYSEVTTAFYTSVHDVLTGKKAAQAAVSDLEQTLTSIKGDGW